MVGVSPGPGMALFVRTEALRICPDCTWPPRNFPKIVRISDSAYFSPKKWPDRPDLA